MFEKSYLPNFTEEIFTVYKRMARQVPVYKLKDDAGEILDGTFYEPELQKIIKNDDVYRVEKILQKRKRKGLVEFLVRWKAYEDPNLIPGFKKVIFWSCNLCVFSVVNKGKGFSLPQTLNLTGEWEVALTEIHYPHSWNNIQQFRFYVRNEKLYGVWDSLEMFLGHYSSVEDVLQKMKGLVDNENRYSDDVYAPSICACQQKQFQTIEVNIKRVTRICAIWVWKSVANALLSSESTSVLLKMKKTSGPKS